MLRTLARLDSLDVRWLYLALLTFIVLTAFIRVPIKIRLSPEAQGFYDAIERLDGTKPVLIQSDWDQGTIGELRAQFTNTARHLFVRNLRFVVISGIPTGAEFYEPVLADLAAEYGKRYGRDWIEVGFKLPDPKEIAIEALSRNFPRAVQTDSLGRRPGEYPWLRNVKVADDWGLVITISYQEHRAYITYFYETARTPYVAGVAAISSTPLYPFITTGNIKGMLVGARGGGEYEQQMGQYGFGSRLLLGESAGHLLLLIGIILGNLGTLARRRLGGRETRSP